MGMDQHVTFAEDKSPKWAALTALLAEHDYPVDMRMIDGELAFPDEMPPDNWRELRVGTAAGMITLRREPGRVTAVTWGNADEAMMQAWNALTWAVARVTDGQIVCAAGTISAAEFANVAIVPPGIATDHG